MASINLNRNINFEWFVYGWAVFISFISSFVSFRHKKWDVCKLWYVSTTLQWSNRVLVCKDWIMVHVFS
jgi:hypothetical protein